MLMKASFWGILPNCPGRVKASKSLTWRCWSRGGPVPGSGAWFGKQLPAFSARRQRIFPGTENRKGNAPYFEGFRTPPALKRIEQIPGWKLPPLAARYPCRPDGMGHGGENITWSGLHPATPLLEPVRRHTLRGPPNT